MGGSRFAENGGSVRLSRPAHERLSTQVIATLGNYGLTAIPLRVMRSKMDFGDVDLLIARSSTHGDLPDDGAVRGAEIERRDQILANALGAVLHGRIAPVDPTVNFLVPTDDGPAQVDLTSIEDEHLDFAEAHLAWGDASSLAAVVARQMSIKMGMNGVRLVMKTRSGEAEAALPLTHAQTLELVGFDAAAHTAGFSTNEEAFAWIASSTYFNPSIWSHEWRTSKARARGMKRPTYIAWSAWLERNQPPARYDWGAARGTRSDEWLVRLREQFPDTARELDEQVARRAARLDGPVRTFFTGRRISEATGVTGDGLMHLMNAVRTKIGEEELARMEQEDDVAGLLVVARRLAPAF